MAIMGMNKFHTKRRGMCTLCAYLSYDFSHGVGSGDISKMQACEISF